MIAVWIVRDSANPSRPGKEIARYRLSREADAHCQRLNRNAFWRTGTLDVPYYVTADDVRG